MGVGLAPIALAYIIYMGAWGTRSFMPFMSAGVLMALLAVVCRAP